jgi:hypothetical protein
MEAGFIESHIARGNRNLLGIGLALTVTGGGLAILLGRWIPAFIAITGAIALGAWLIRVLNPSAHPIYKRLERYGDPRELAQQVNQEFAGARPADTTHFGENWLAQGDTYGLSLVPWGDVAWLHIYTNARNGLQTNYVRVWSRDGKQFVALAGMHKEEAMRLLSELHARAPWAEVGFSRELQRQWNNQRAEFVDRVDGRKSRVGQTLRTSAASTSNN